MGSLRKQENQEQVLIQNLQRNVSPILGHALILAQCYTVNNCVLLFYTTKFCSNLYSSKTCACFSLNNYSPPSPALQFPQSALWKGHKAQPILEERLDSTSLKRQSSGINVVGILLWRNWSILLDYNCSFIYVIMDSQIVFYVSVYQISYTSLGQNGSPLAMDPKELCD